MPVQFTRSFLEDALAVLRELCPASLPVGLDTHEAALRLAERYGFAMFDALMVAAALDAGSTTLWSEDMQHGMLIDGTLRITDPFRTSA